MFVFVFVVFVNFDGSLREDDNHPGEKLMFINCLQHWWLLVAQLIAALFLVFAGFTIEPMAVAQKDVPKWPLGKWNQRPTALEF